MSPTRLRCALVLGSLLAAAAQAQDLSVRAIESYQNFDNGLFATAGLRQTYDLRLERALTDPVTFRLSLRLEDFRSANDLADLPASARHSHGLLLQPGGEFLYSLQAIQAQFNYDLLRQSNESGSVQDTRRIERQTGRFAWRPDGFPTISFDGTRHHARDDASKLNTTDTLGQMSVGYDWRHLRVAAVERATQYNDGHYDFARRTHDQQGLISYNQAFFDGKLTAVADVNGTKSRFQERATAGGPVLIPAPVTIARADSGIDDTPLDDRDRPLLPNPALVDNNFNVSAGIAIGPEGQSYWNIAFDLGRFTQIDEIRVHVRDAANNAVRRGGGVRWDLYRSEDGILWTPMPSQALFDLAQSLYTISFKQVTVRWLKIISFGVESDPTFVTETTAAFHTLLAANEVRTTDMQLLSSTASVGTRPLRWLWLAYNGLYNNSQQRPSNRPAFSSRDTDHTATVEIAPSRSFTLTTRIDKRTLEQTSAPLQTLQSITGVARYLPIRQFDVSVEATNQNEVSQGKTIDMSTTMLHLSARILPSLDLRGTIGRQRQDFVTDDRMADGHFANGSLTAQLTRTLRLMIDGGISRTTYSGTGDVVQGLPPARDDRASAEFYWRGGQPLALGVRIGHVSTDQLSTTTQRYRVEWYPFGGGTVSIGMTYDEDVDPYANRTSKRMMVAPRWVMNRHAILDFNYTFIDTSGLFATRTRSFYTTLTLTN